ncbi:peptide chain release factor N(5)-glutamine methyltransferase [Caryophanon tenue]|uniref:Release factor glutamine methyltransferase n=1 Tax=Caryophanon tenue TaxID=33978 RepID=A0A1C0Y830_9BACL|nr:peptide chain release factor N(5)-glutamine methyltransferase [Caryophanon tenue]OCS83324.1 protein-(glutamine-N5) methyltransferase, release factor-specific [Caryophanon tenue]
MTKTHLEVLHWASSFLIEHDREETAARLLLQHVTGKSYSALMMAMHDAMDAEQIELYNNMVEQHAQGRPVQYITGVEEFYGRTFMVDESVLIPRPETEELIVGALTRIRKLFGDAPIRLADIGTGSGAIAITMKLEAPQLDVVATDLSESALATATKNAAALQADIAFRLGDLTEPIATEKWDVILSNPPYIAHEDLAEMSEVVTAHEPHSALFADEDGLILYRKLAEQVGAMINRPAFIGVEIGYTQGAAVAGFFREHFPQAVIEIVNDINGKERMVFCEIQA